MDNLPNRVIDVPAPIPTESVGKKIVLFGQPTCPDCARVKKFLADNAIEYEYRDITTDKEANKWLTSFASSVPVLVMWDGSIKYSPSNEELLAYIQTTSINKKVTMVEPQVFDTIIIGGGPAGITAAVYAVRKSLKVLLVTKVIGGQAAMSGDIENYPGFTMVSGVDLAAKFREEVERFQDDGIWIKEGVDVSGIEGIEGGFMVKTAQNGSYRTKTVLIASGRIPRLLGVPGEKEFFGRGVATCATCDAPLFKGKNVAVVGGGNSALDATVALMKLAKEVTIVNNTESLRGDAMMLQNVTSAPNVKVLNGSQVTEVSGSKFVEGLKVKDSAGQETVIPVDGVFIEIGWVPSVGFVPPEVKLDEQKQIVVDEYGKTSFDGIWAAGDVNNLWGEQIVIAAGEGAKVALSISEHIAKLPHQATSNVHEG